MGTKKCLLIIAVIMAVAQEIHTACVCNEKGTDACAACSEILVVRPQPKYGKKPDIALPPIGDNCWCSKTMIQPASLPKPCGKSKKPPLSSSCACQPTKPLPSIFNSPYAVPQLNYVAAPVKDNSLPADPISISLAIQAGKAIEVPEAKLAYGFVQKPIDGLPKVFISSINEENLYALKSDVITLKKPLATNVKPLEDDYPEPEDEEPAPEEYDPPTLTYKQLGYAPELFKNPQFQEVTNALPLPASAALPDKVAVDRGFRPGRIAKYCQY